MASMEGVCTPKLLFPNWPSTAASLLAVRFIANRSIDVRRFDCVCKQPPLFDSAECPFVWSLVLCVGRSAY